MGTRVLYELSDQDGPLSFRFRGLEFPEKTRLGDGCSQGVELVAHGLGHLLRLARVLESRHQATLLFIDERQQEEKLRRDRGRARFVHRLQSSEPDAARLLQTPEATKSLHLLAGNRDSTWVLARRRD